MSLKDGEMEKCNKALADISKSPELMTFLNLLIQSNDVRRSVVIYLFAVYVPVEHDISLF